jgi:hypothetical protein
MRQSIFVAIALTLLLGSAPRAARSGISVTPAGPPAEFELTRVYMDAAGNGWGQSIYDVFVRLDGGQVHRADAVSEFIDVPTADLAALLPDGGALFRDTESGIGCRALRKLGSDGRQRWTAPLCGHPHVTPQGDIWVVAPRRIVRLGSDGSIQAELPQAAVDALTAGLLSNPPPLKMTHDGKALVAANLAAAGAAYTATLVRVNLDSGEVAWRWRGAETWNAPLLLQPGEDGSAYLLGGDSERKLQLARISPQGTQAYLRRELTSSVYLISPPDGLLAHRDGRASLYTYDFASADSVDSVVQLDAAGNTAWRRELRDLRSSRPSPSRLTEAADGSVLAIGPAPGNGQRFYRLDRTGQITADRALPSGTLSSGNGPLYLAGLRGQDRLSRISDDGALSPTAYADATLSSETRIAASAAGAGNAQFLLTTSLTRIGLRFRQQWLLSRVEADGRVSWTQRGDQVLHNPALLSTNAERICSVSNRSDIAPDGSTSGSRPVVACSDAVSGRQLWSRDVLADFANSFSRSLQLLPGNRLLLIRGDTTRHVSVLLDADGNTIEEASRPGGTSQAASSAGGFTAVALYTQEIGPPDRFVVYGPDARPVLEIPPSALQLRTAAIAVADDGALALQGSTAGTSLGPQFVIHSDRSGARIWRHELPPLAAAAGTPAKLLLDTDTLYVIQRRNEPAEQPTVMTYSPTRISAYARADGALRWRYESTNQNSRRHAVTLSTDGQRLLSVHGQAGRLRVELIDKASGTRLAEQFVACEAIDCEPHRVSAGSDGVTRISADIQTVAEGRRSAVYARAGLDRVLVNARIDQPGIAGAWWSPYANGEGLALDWLPDSRTVFGAWFTYTREGGNDAAQLRWYTVQANGVASAATTLELPILQTAGGNFDAGPPVTPQPVGRAWLSFTDCNNGTLRYAFDAAHNGGAAGSITLTRLTPATEACMLADGSTQPAAGARPPENGFDTRMAGSWYEEATSGQGLQLTVQPGGVFFAPWFTYDPQETGNDTARQHWFTLQGNLATAVNGRVELLLVQTLGGAFDSVPTYNAYQVGTATLTMNACDRATLEYRFADDARAGPYANRTGTLELAKAGGCR